MRLSFSQAIIGPTSAPVVLFAGFSKSLEHFVFLNEPVGSVLLTFLVGVLDKIYFFIDTSLCHWYRFYCSIYQGIKLLHNSNNTHKIYIYMYIYLKLVNINQSKMLNLEKRQYRFCSCENVKIQYNIECYHPRGRIPEQVSRWTPDGCVFLCGFNALTTQPTPKEESGPPAWILSRPSPRVWLKDRCPLEVKPHLNTRGEYFARGNILWWPITVGGFPWWPVRGP